MKTVSLVRKPASPSPSTGGIAGRLPVASRMYRVSSTRPPAATVCGPVTRASPETSSTPSALIRSGLSSVAAIPSWMVRMRRHTSVVSTSGSTAPMP